MDESMVKIKVPDFMNKVVSRMCVKLHKYVIHIARDAVIEEKWASVGLKGGSGKIPEGEWHGWELRMRLWEMGDRSTFLKEGLCASSLNRDIPNSLKEGDIWNLHGCPVAGMKNGTAEVDQGFVVGVHGDWAGEQLNSKLEFRSLIIVAVQTTVEPAWLGA